MSRFKRFVYLRKELYAVLTKKALQTGRKSYAAVSGKTTPLKRNMHSSKRRFDNLCNIPALQEELTAKHQVDYTKYDKYDLGAVYYDWDSYALYLLKRILKETGAKIVVSSDWRSAGIQRLVDFFRLHGLNEYVVDITEDFTRNEIVYCREKYKDVATNCRVFEILEYLEKHPYIQKYAVIDDMNLNEGLEGHFVQTNNLLNRDDCEKAIAMLL